MASVVRLAERKKVLQMGKKYEYVYFEAEIICPRCGRMVSHLSPDKEKAISAGTGFMCVACNVLVQIMLISPTRADEQRHAPAEAGGACTCISFGADTTHPGVVMGDCPIHGTPRLGG